MSIEDLGATGHPTPNDEAALRDSGPLLRFAAENIDNLDQAIALTIATAIDAARQNAWTPAVSQAFWNAFSKLGDLIKPVTLDCIKISQQSIKVDKWLGILGEVRYISVAEQTARRYIALLLVVLGATLLIQLYAWSIDSAAQSLTKAATLASAQTEALHKSYASLSASTGDPKHVWSNEEKTTADSIGDQSDDLHDSASAALATASSLKKWTELSSGGLTAPAEVSCPPDEQGRSQETAWWCKGERALKLWSYTATAIAQLRSSTSLIVGVLISYVLPTLLGLAGSISYVVRNISEQIKTTTFSTASPLRHLIRVGLGTMMGGVVGLFTGLTQHLDLSPLAVAFLAGYGVEAMFSLFDALLTGFQKVLK